MTTVMAVSGSNTGMRGFAALAAALSLLALGACQKMNNGPTTAAEQYPTAEHVQFNAPVDKILAADKTIRPATVDEQTQKSSAADQALAVADREEDGQKFQAIYMFDPATKGLSNVAWHVDDATQQMPVLDKLTKRYGPGRDYARGDLAIREWNDPDKKVAIRAVRAPDRFMMVTFEALDQKAPGEQTGIITLK